MADRDLVDLRYRAIQCLGEIGELACNATEAESALQRVTRAVLTSWATVKSIAVRVRLSPANGSFSFPASSC